MQLLVLAPAYWKALPLKYFHQLAIINNYAEGAI